MRDTKHREAPEILKTKEHVLYPRPMTRLASILLLNKTRSGNVQATFLNKVIGDRNRDGNG